MCDCTLIASGVFEPILIQDNELGFAYTDRKGIRHILIDKFRMDIEISYAEITEVTENGKIVAYQFTLKGNENA